MFEHPEIIQNVEDKDCVGFFCGKHVHEVMRCLQYQKWDQVFLDAKSLQKNLFQSSTVCQFFFIRPTNSFIVKMKQKSSLNQIKVYVVLVVGLQKPSVK